MDVSDWVEGIAGDAIRQQASRVEAMERDQAGAPFSSDVHIVQESAATRVLTATGRSRRITPLARIGLFLRGLDNDYQYLLHEECLAAVKECGFSMRDFVGHNDAALQKRQIEDCLREPEASRVSIILVNPIDEAALRDVAFEAAKAGIGWVSLNRSADYLDELRLDYPDHLFFCVSPEQRQIGRIQGRLLQAFLPDGGDVLYVEGPRGTSSSRQRREGTEHEIGGTKIRLYAEDADWTVEGGARAARRWLERFGHGLRAMPVVCAQNDGMAIGARSVLVEAAGSLYPGLREEERPPIVVIGCDGTPSYGQRLLAENLLSATVVVPSTTRKAVLEFASYRDRGALASPASITISVEPLPLRIIEKARRGATIMPPCP
jgi:ABC-type sugar transport system substrate-binding protein